MNFFKEPKRISMAAPWEGSHYHYLCESCNFDVCQIKKDIPFDELCQCCKKHHRWEKEE